MLVLFPTHPTGTDTPHWTASGPGTDYRDTGDPGPGDPGKGHPGAGHDDRRPVAASPDGARQVRSLAAIEQELFTLRRAPPDVASALRAALVHVGGPDMHRPDQHRGDRHGRDARLVMAGERIVQAVETASHGGELAYHNRHHIAEVVLAMGWLCGIARRNGDISADVASLGVVAMAGHDLLHDGSPPVGGVLERRAADAVARAVADVGLGPRQRGMIAAAIGGTNPDLIASNAERAAGQLPAGRYGRPVDLMIAMANEADVFSSLLPRLGPHLTHLLADERRRAGFPEAADITGPRSRLAFLGTYARLSPAARQMGLGELRNAQVAAAALALSRSGAAVAAPDAEARTP